MTKRNFLSAAFISVFGIGCKKAPAEKSEDHTIEITNAKLGESSSDDVFLAKRVDAPWGDYGSILINGIVSGGGRREADRFDVLSLERTGPFVPPISFPGIGNIVVTDAMKQAMEHAGFRGIQYQVVRKKLIVESDWHTWDRSAKEPVRYPKGESRRATSMSESTLKKFRNRSAHFGASHSARVRSSRGLRLARISIWTSKTATFPGLGKVRTFSPQPATDDAISQHGPQIGSANILAIGSMCVPSAGQMPPTSNRDRRDNAEQAFLAVLFVMPLHDDMCLQNRWAFVGGFD